MRVRLKRAGIITKIVILAIIVYAGITLVTVKNQTVQARQTREELQVQVAEISQENAGLHYDIEHSADDETLENIARNKLGLVKPGEKIFYDISN